MVVAVLYPSIVTTSVGGLKGLILENEKIRAVVMPQFGARIISLIYKPTETEFAWHNPTIPVKKPSYQIEFEDVSGFFDCLPTTEPCTFKGKKLPAAGEVSSEPWKLLRLERGRKSITVGMQCACKVYPLLINKQLSISRGKAVLDLTYRLRNLCDEKLEYHYSGHNTLCINPYYRIILPHEVSRLRIGYAVTDRLGKMGDEIQWPEALDKEGKTVDLSKVGKPCEGTGENLYTAKLRESWCAAMNEAREEVIGFSFQAEVLPYLLVWINYGGWREYYHIALEPCTGRPDNLEVAVNQWKNYATLGPREAVSWSETIVLGHDVKRVERVTADEGIVE